MSTKPVDVEALRGHTPTDCVTVAAVEFDALLAEVIERRARDAQVSDLVEAAKAAAVRLWMSENRIDRSAGDDLDAALAALAALRGEP